MPGMTLVEPPCQVRVQPPAWLPMLSALLPATYTCSTARERQGVPVVLQQHLRLARPPGGRRAVGRVADLGRWVRSV